MEQLTRDKFRRNPDIRERLKQTQDRPLINAIADKHAHSLDFESSDNLLWGRIGKQGENQLGLILEKVRTSINSDFELEDWLSSLFVLPTSSELGVLPIV